MKNLLYTIIVLLGFNIYSQKKEFLLSELDNRLLNEINDQGFRNFKNSPFYNTKHTQLFIYPVFWVKAKNSFEYIDFFSINSIFSNFYFERKSKKRLENWISWVIVNKNNNDIFNSDFKKFYSYNNESKDYGNIQFRNPFSAIELDNILYSFNIQGFNGFLTFYVTKSNKIFIYDFKLEKIITLEEFDKALKEKKYIYEKL